MTNDPYATAVAAQQRVRLRQIGAVTAVRLRQIGDPARLSAAAFGLPDRHAPAPPPSDAGDVVPLNTMRKKEQSGGR